MNRRPARSMSSVDVAMNPRPFRMRQHDIDVFYALVGGGKNAPMLKDEPQEEKPGEPAPADATASRESQVPRSTPPGPAKPVRRPPAWNSAATTAAVAPADSSPGEDVSTSAAGPADWAAALHGIAPKPRPVTRTQAKPSRRSQLSWSPKVLCSHLVKRVDQLHVDSWVRKVSGDAMRRLSQAQSRLNSNRPKHRPKHQ